LLLAAVLVLMLLLGIGFGRFLVNLPPAASDLTAQADGIVALTGEGSRLAPAVTLLEKGSGKRLLITGVNPQTSKPYLKKLLHGGDAFDCCADLGFTALDTRGNAQEAAKWASARSYHSLIIVTSGTITEYMQDCTPHAYTFVLGQPAPTLVDPGDGHLHVIRNEGSVPASTITVQLIPYDPAKANRRIDAPAPETCPNIM